MGKPNSMKYLSKLFLIISLPLFIGWLRQSERNRLRCYAALGALPFLLNAFQLDLSPISWAAWPGYAKGLTFTIVDTLALAILITHRNPRGYMPLTALLIAYVAAAAISILMANVKMAAVFYVFQLIRVLVVFLAVAKIAGNPKAVRYLLMGMAIGISYQAGLTIWQRANGVFQAMGSMGHQNLLGMMTHFVTLPLLAALLGGMRSRLVLLGVISGLVVITLGASRGAIAFGIGGVVVLIIASFLRGMTPTKGKIAAIGLVAVLAVSPLVYEGLSKRYANLEAAGDYDERAAFKRAANAMWSDHPFGVGANEYVVVANTQGYSARAGVAWNWGSRSANVHNTYLLVAAETGWFGLIAFSAILIAALLSGFRFAFSDRKDPRGDVVLGCTIAILAAAVHILYEWVFVTYQAQYMYAISLGLIAGTIRAKAIERRRPAVTAPPVMEPQLA